MKKLLILIVAACVSLPVFAMPDLSPADISLSAGGGGIFNTHWHRDTLRSRFRNYHGLDIMPPYGIMGPTEQTQSAMRQGLFDTGNFTAGGGFFGFVDATFATLGLGMVFNNVRQIIDVPNLADTVSYTLAGQELREFTVTQLNLSLMLRYPVEVAEGWRVFPMLGIDGQIALGDFDDSLRSHFQRVANFGYEVPTMGQFWNSLWIRFGAGVDFSLFGNVFLRGEMLYGFRLNSSHDSRMSGYWTGGVRGTSNGLHIRIAAGYTFWTRGE